MDVPRFAVDRMLGRLARWLRLLGFDAAYRAELPGSRLLTLAAREDRIVLTRDGRLRGPRGRTRVIQIHSDRFRDQLRELDHVLPLGGAAERPQRCLACNVAVAIERVPAQVPDYVRGCCMSVTSSGRSSTSSTMSTTSGWFAVMPCAMFCSITVLPVRGGATIKPRWPLPIGVIRSRTRVVTSGGSEASS
jgi:uncharacterized protein with PIN domain